MTSKGEVSLYYTWNENIADLDKNTTLNGVLTIDPKEYGTIFSSETHPLEIGLCSPVLTTQSPRYVLVKFFVTGSST